MLSRITGCGFFPSTRRTVSCGSSDNTVPIPTAMASCAARSWCVMRMLSGPLILSACPRRVLILPSRLCAQLSVINGCPVRMRCFSAFESQASIGIFVTVADLVWNSRQVQQMVHPARFREEIFRIVPMDGGKDWNTLGNHHVQFLQV
jgi:hypothetical protein